MKNSFLEYYKYILEKVSFDKGLLKKEYLKAVKFLRKDDAVKLQQWAKSKGLQPLKIK